MIILTGGSGFLGNRIIRMLETKYQVLAPSHSALDITNRNAVFEYFNNNLPEAVIHCAALSNTWYCEQHPEHSLQVNVNATVTLAEMCKEYGAKFIFISSDQVYNGTHLEGPLHEQVPLNPVNVYGCHKLLAEERVFDILPNAIGLRLTWMYDNPQSKLKLNSNIMTNLCNAYKNKENIKASIYEHRGITNVWEVAKNIEKCFPIAGGIYNFGSENNMNSFDTFRCCARKLQIPETVVLADTERYKDQPRNLSMETTLIRKYGIDFHHTLEFPLEEYKIHC